MRWTGADATTQCVELGVRSEILPHRFTGVAEACRRVGWPLFPLGTMSGAASGGDKSRLALPTRVDVLILPE